MYLTSSLTRLASRKAFPVKPGSSRSGCGLANGCSAAPAGHRCKYRLPSSDTRVPGVVPSIFSTSAPASGAAAEMNGIAGEYFGRIRAVETSSPPWSVPAETRISYLVPSSTSRKFPAGKPRTIRRRPSTASLSK
jgi:hypothetical protein